MKCQVMMEYMREVACKDTQEMGMLKMKSVVKGTIEGLVGGSLMLSMECQVMMGNKGEVVGKDTQENQLVKMKCVLKGTIESLAGEKFMLSMDILATRAFTGKKGSGKIAFYIEVTYVGIVHFQ